MTSRNTHPRTKQEIKVSDRLITLFQIYAQLSTSASEEELYVIRQEMFKEAGIPAVNPFLKGQLEDAEEEMINSAVEERNARADAGYWNEKERREGMTYAEDAALD